MIRNARIYGLPAQSACYLKASVSLKMTDCTVTSLNSLFLNRNIALAHLEITDFAGF